MDLGPPGAWTRVVPLVFTNVEGFGPAIRIPQTEASGFFRLSTPAGPIPGLTGHWTLDEGTGALAADASVSSVNLTLSNTTWTDGRIGGGALRFNGAAAGNPVGSRAWGTNAGYRVFPPDGEPFTLSCWLRPDGLPAGTFLLIGENASGAAGWQLVLRNTGIGTNELILSGASAPNSLVVTGRTLLLPGQWRQLALTYDGAEAVIYLDAVPLGRGRGRLVSHDGPFFCGGGLAGANSFAGSLDEIRVRPSGLTADEVALRGRWTFDESAGAALIDSGPEGQAALLSDPSARVSGRRGSGVDLTRGQVVVPNSALTVLPASGGAFSVSLWFLPTGPFPPLAGLLRAGDDSSGGWRLDAETDGSGATQLRWDSTARGGTLSLAAPLVVTNGSWTKLDLTYNGGVATIYVNARAVASASGAIRAGRGPVTLGGGGGVAAWPGVADEFCLYGRERAAGEIGPVALTVWETVFRNGSTNLVLPGFGPAGRPLTYSLLAAPGTTNGVATQPADGAGTIRYQAGDRKGPDAFAYTVCDGEFTSAPALVLMSVVEPHWLSPGGGTAGVRDGRSPEGAWATAGATALDAVWATNNYYDCFLYAPGLYQTHGWKYNERSSANPGCKHIGSGPDRTTVQLVDIWAATAEETVFCPAAFPVVCDGFEVRDLTLDCNAEHVPKYTRGEPTWIRVPLAAPAQVTNVTLRWASTYNASWLYGRPAEYTICARRFGTNVSVTNCVSVATAASLVDVIPIGAQADELYLTLNLRSLGVDFYGLSEMEISGGQIRVPSAQALGGGESRLGADYSILQAFDEDPTTAWASGPEPAVQIDLPLPAATTLSAVQLRWYCRSVNKPGRLGPAAALAVQARDEITGQLQVVPIVRHGWGSNGLETVTFGTSASTNPVTTDHLVLLLTEREAGVDYYSLSEITLQNGPQPVSMGLPTASSRNTWGNFSVLRAFDHDTNTLWAGTTQGMVGAINVPGSNLKFTNLRVIGFGTKAGRECFPAGTLYSGPSVPALALGNVLFEDCVFSDPAIHNRDGLTTLLAAHLPAHRLTNAIVRRCRVSGVKSLFTYSHAFVAVHTEFSEAEDCQVGVYWEPELPYDDIGPFLVQSNRFTDVTYGVYFLTHPNSHYGALTILGNDIALDLRESWGFLSCDTCDAGIPGVLTNITILNNVIRYGDWGTALHRGGGLQASEFQHAIFGNNVVVMDPSQGLRLRQCPSGFLPTPPPQEDCDHAPFFPPPPNPNYPPCLDVLPPGYQRAWFNNRDLTGALLPVRWYHANAEGLATQQQYPE
jgi:hypothetical protein